MDARQLWKLQLEEILGQLEEQAEFRPGRMFVVGCSTSEVAGSRIGTAGAMDIAAILYGPLREFADRNGLWLAFQGCEHINRAVTVEREAAEKYGLDEVSVIPVQKAGGSMAAHAYRQMDDPVVVEGVRAHAGIDIGQTLIGMQLRPVAVPLRTTVEQIGEAVVTAATTRPKLIGGARAVYVPERDEEEMDDFDFESSQTDEVEGE
ncbi:TIGR01440 family protein [Bhargavaea ginsengi]|uniref:TIGR01440 family protein n=1 Tax=Bhargavaea ginsengi TaxID=426757 RepID=UPI00203AF5B1|nr:TIGR01440 family protein [Bhargavaea ginsengi]MCM3087186.1 TIGR01440 family protein [Bhargavaea ginsengi]